MIGPVQNLNNTSSIGQSMETVRADLMVGAPQSDTEMTVKAVGGTANCQDIPSELPPHIHDVANQIGQIKSEFKRLEDKTQKYKDLEEIRLKLLLGKKSANSGDFKAPIIPLSISEFDKFINLDNGSDIKKDLDFKNSNPIQFKKTSSSLIKQDQPIKDTSLAGIEDQQNIILRIDEALNALNTILVKINSDQSNSNNRLLSLTGSISGLNSARSVVDKTHLSLNVASNAVDIIMTNVKTAVLSHGKISNDIVRLILS